MTGVPFPGSPLPRAGNAQGPVTRTVPHSETGTFPPPQWKASSHRQDSDLQNLSMPTWSRDESAACGLGEGCLPPWGMRVAPSEGGDSGESAARARVCLGCISLWFNNDLNLGGGSSSSRSPPDGHPGRVMRFVAASCVLGPEAEQGEHLRAGATSPEGAATKSCTRL